jgi:hypothetical protein
MYALQRANGDWFAVKADGRLCVPVFRSSGEAMQARARNAGMMLFKPVALDEHALSEFEPTNGNSAVSFWLVKNPTANLNHSSPLEHAQLAQLICEMTEPEQSITMKGAPK